jgi:hypothetical protein
MSNHFIDIGLYFTLDRGFFSSWVNISTSLHIGTE